MDDKISYEEFLVQIHDRQVKKWMKKVVASMKDLWGNQLVEMAT